MMTVQEAEKHLLAHGGVKMSLAALDAELKRLGYRRTPDSRTVYIARELDTGNTWPETGWSVHEIDSGMSFAHFQARRDANFKALQELRFKTFCVVQGRILCI